MAHIRVNSTIASGVGSQVQSTICHHVTTQAAVGIWHLPRSKARHDTGEDVMSRTGKETAKIGRSTTERWAHNSNFDGLLDGMLS